MSWLDYKHFNIQVHSKIETHRIDFNFVIKVADFGLSESIDTSKQYFRQDKQVVVRLPIKWLAPESINDGIFSEKTDVVNMPIIILTQASILSIHVVCRA